MPISIEDGSHYMSEVSNFNGIQIQEIVNKHMRAGKAPIGHHVLTRNLIKRYPNWIEMDFI
tara:strand:+ start:286 stop:468 length:183 start_codon:yes stop_codon:yes gene_type:complete